MKSGCELVVNFYPTVVRKFLKIEEFPINSDNFKEIIYGLGPGVGSIIRVNGKEIVKLDIERELTTNPMVLVSVFGTLLGGKGGFGSLLKGQRGRRKKGEYNIDACRDLNGVRIRHSRAAERLEQWKKKKEEEKEILELLGKDETEKDEEVYLENDFIKKIKKQQKEVPKILKVGLKNENQIKDQKETNKNMDENIDRELLDALELELSS